MLAGALGLLVWLSPSALSARQDAIAWNALRSPGHAALLRHALAPGGGDPPAFRLGDCSSQRNLSEEGRRQARRIGEQFRRSGLGEARVVSSQWCRCLETARLLGLGAVQEQPAFNSFFGRPELAAAATRTMRGWLSGQRGEEPLVVVTHQVNVTALTGIAPASGAMVVVRLLAGGGTEVVGLIPAP